MCLIIHKPKANLSIPKEILNRCEHKNPDGFGIIFLDDGECWKTKDYNRAWKAVNQKRPFVAHYRYATVGSKTEANCHPFPVSSHSVLFMNGTVKTLKEDDKTDSQVVAEMLGTMRKRDWPHMLRMTDARFAIIHRETKEVLKTGEWHEKDGIFYSKNDCFQAGFWDRNHQSRGRNIHAPSHGNYYDGYEYDEAYGSFYPGSDYQNTRQAQSATQSKKKSRQSHKRNSTQGSAQSPEKCFAEDKEILLPEDNEWDSNAILAVYGTCKQGFINHSLLGDSQFIGYGQSIDKLRMISTMDTPDCMPTVWLGDHESGKHINVELYKVTDVRRRAALDEFSQIPFLYERKLVEIFTHDAEPVMAWMYVDPSEAPEFGRFTESYDP